MPVHWETATLESGLRVVTTPVPTAQSVCVNVFVGVGSRAEQPRTNGISHYLEHLMFKGTERRHRRRLPPECRRDAGLALGF